MGTLSRLGVGVPLRTVHRPGTPATRARYVPILSQGGLEPARDRDYYLRRRRRQVRGDARTQLPPAPHATLCSSSNTARATRRRRRERDRPGDGARAQCQWTRVEMRDPVKTYNKTETSALATAAPAFDWPGWLDATGAGRRRRATSSSSSRAISAPSAQLERRRCRRGRVTCAPRSCGAYAPVPRQGLRRRALRLRRHDARRATENRPRWKRGVALVDSSIGEALGKLYVEKYFPPASKARMESSSPTCSPPTSESIDGARLDGAGDAEARRRPSSRSSTPKIGYPEALDRLQHARRSRRDDLVGNVDARAPFELDAQHREARQADRPRRMVHDAADRQRLLQPVAERDRLPGGDPAAAVLRRASADDAVNYGGDRRGHRPRDQPRLRRPGQPVRRRRQPARLVDRRKIANASTRRRRSLVAQYSALSAGARATTSTAS